MLCATADLQLQRARFSDVIPPQATAKAEEDDEEDQDFDELDEPESDDEGGAQRREALKIDDLKGDEDMEDEDADNGSDNEDEHEVAKAAKGLKGRNRGVSEDGISYGVIH